MSHVAQLPWLFGKPQATVVLKQQPEDFEVEELFEVELSGKGEHLWIWLEKRDLATPQAVAAIARALNVDRRDVSHSGLKDKRAVTRQWLSVWLPGKGEPEGWQASLPPGLTVLRCGRHERKLRRGSHQGNRFAICLRQVSDVAAVEARLQQLATTDLPNFFGPQRFGHGDSNLTDIATLLNGARLPRWRESLILSAARSALFNLMVAERMANHPWPTLLVGDRAALNGSRSFFAVEAVDEALLARLGSGDIAPTAALWGRGEPATSGWTGTSERAIAAAHPDWCALVERAGMEQERRAVSIRVADLDWQWQGADLTIRFTLARGCFATTVLRELVNSDGEADGDEDTAE